jgi:hypothetical protein
MISEITQPRLSIAAAQRSRKAKDFTAVKRERKVEERLWRIGVKKSDHEWIIFSIFGAIALAALVPALDTLFHLLRTDAILHVAERVSLAKPRTIE